MASTDTLPLAAFIIMLFPMLYFFLTTWSFFFFKFSDPSVTWMMRGLLNTYFLSLAGCCLIAVVAFLSASRPAVALCLGVVGMAAVGARRWFLGQVDGELRAQDAGDRNAAHRLRRLHMGGMAYNIVQGAVFVASIPHVFGGIA